MGHVVIRPATPDDAGVIAEIHVASWQGAYRGMLADEYLDGLSADDRLPMWTRILSSEPSPMHVGVAEAGGDVVGFYSIGPSNEDDPEEVQMLYTIYLHPGAMGKGIGRRLIADAEQQMRSRGATVAVLRVITSNEKTLAFYERCGWTMEPGSERMEDAWGVQVETVRYRKRLQGIAGGT